MTATSHATVGRGLTRRARAVDTAVFETVGSVRAMAVLRIALGPITIAHLWPFLTATARGTTFRDRFSEPFFGALASVPGPTQTVLVWGAAVAAVGLGLGWRTRLTAALCWLGVTGNVLLDQTQFRHNRAFLIFLLAAVALSDSGRALSLDARRRRRKASPVSDGGSTGGFRSATGPLWPVWLIRALAASVYGASGFSKLIDPDWVGGLVLWDRAVRYRGAVTDRVPGAVGEWVADVVTTRWVHAVTSPMAVAMELFICIGIWFGRTRLAAVWVAVFFHLSIEVAAAVEVFSAAAIVALVIWTTPDERARTVEVGSAGAATWIRRLDWLARFDVRQGRAGIRVIDRDGRTWSGRAAWALVASRLPVTFFPVAPWWAWQRRHR